MEGNLFLVALLLSLSYILKRSGIFKEEHAEVLINYTIYFSLPSLVFLKIRETDFRADTLNVIFLAWFSILFAVLVSLLTGKLLRLDNRTLKSFILVSSFGNTAYMGYPFTYAVFGEEGLKYAVIYDQFGSFTMVASVGYLIAKGRFSLRELILFPPFSALILSLTLKNFYIPEIIIRALEVASLSLIPVVLFSLGIKFSFSGMFSSLKIVLIALTLKMFLVPFTVFILLKLFSLDTLPYRVLLLESSMPPMVMASVLAIKYRLNESVATSSVTLGIPLSFITSPLFLELFDRVSL